jgi:hypothetical protein
LSYGNEALVETRYSCAAILVLISPLNPRKQNEMRVRPNEIDPSEATEALLVFKLLLRL